MTLQQIRKVIKDIKNLLKPETFAKIFIIKDDGLTYEEESEEDIDAWGAAHPEAQVFKMRCENFRDA